MGNMLTLLGFSPIGLVGSKGRHNNINQPLSYLKECSLWI